MLTGVTSRKAKRPNYTGVTEKVSVAESGLPYKGVAKVEGVPFFSWWQRRWLFR